MIKKYLTKENVLILTCLLVVLHPLIETDYNFYNGTFPRLTTLVDLVILPLLVLVNFYVFDKNKKRTFIVALIWGILLAIYFILHCKNAASLVEIMHMPSNFFFTIKEEFTYMLALLLPLAYIYVFVIEDMKEAIFKKLVLLSSSLISIPIFIADLFGFGNSTYGGPVKGNFFSWFSLPYEETGDLIPKHFAAKFFFEEGNTTGILLIMILPLVYYFFFKADSKKEKITTGTLLFIQSIAMLMLSTRVSVYGTILVPVVMVAINVFLRMLKIEKLNVLFIGFAAVMSIVSSLIMPYTPSYNHQKLDAQSDWMLSEADKNQFNHKKEIKDKLNNLDLMPYSEEWYNFYIHIFEDNAWMINATPKVYFLDYYHYKYDPKFWVDVIFDIELEDRTSGRQIENIFENYKWEPLNTYQKTMGMGYSTFMWGSILLEQDFTQQIYSYGYLGFMLIMSPWLVMAAYLGIKLILGYKKGYWSFFNIVTMMSICIGFGCSYLSGHTFDELTTSLFIALCAGTLFNSMKKKEKEVENVRE